MARTSLSLGWAEAQRQAWEGRTSWWRGCRAVGGCRPEGLEGAKGSWVSCAIGEGSESGFLWWVLDWRQGQKLEGGGVHC